METKVSAIEFAWSGKTTVHVRHPAGWSDADLWASFFAEGLEYVSLPNSELSVVAIRRGELPPKGTPILSFREEDLVVGGES